MDFELAANWRLDPEFERALGEAVQASRAAGVRGAPIALVLGSGLGNAVDAMEVEASLGFDGIPGIASSTVIGHAGRLLQARVGDTELLVLQGRLHAYEGLPMASVVLPTALLVALGARTVVMTNAAGGLHPDMRAGDLMVITDVFDLHLVDAVRGVLRLDAAQDRESAFRAARVGPVFDAGLAHALVEVGAEEGLALRTGTYASLWGPNYETPAEIGLLRLVGADAVGMSTGPEAVVARALGAHLVGVSCITNVAVEAGSVTVSHEEVVEVGAARRGDLARLLLAAVPRLAARA